MYPTKFNTVPDDAQAGRDDEFLISRVSHAAYMHDMGVSFAQYGGLKDAADAWACAEHAADMAAQIAAGVFHQFPSHPDVIWC